MFERQTSGSVLCPSCGNLVGVRDEQCLQCGRRNPGMWGFAPALRLLGDDLGFVPLVLWGCGALYLATLAVDMDSIRGGGVLSFLSPSLQSLFLFGASGAQAVFNFGRWWTVLSAGWLHGGLLHILFNMMAVRNLAPATTMFYGVGRTVIIYTISGVAGFTASTLAGRYLAWLPFLRGGQWTIGASASIFGLIGALLYYGRRGGSSLVGEQAKRWALSGLVFGFLVPGIDNWAHLGGLAGGYLAARWLDPLQPERGNHLLWAGVCLLASAAAIVVSVVEGLKMLQ
jgi:rhomboid protease GluP